jgi:hypothetical protein
MAACLKLLMPLLNTTDARLHWSTRVNKTFIGLYSVSDQSECSVKIRVLDSIFSERSRPYFRHCGRLGHRDFSGFLYKSG